MKKGLAEQGTLSGVADPIKSPALKATLKPATSVGFMGTPELKLVGGDEKSKLEIKTGFCSL